MHKTKVLIAEKSKILFLEKGFGETTMQDIIDSVGLSKGAIYHHFNSKDEILEYITSGLRQELNSNIEQLVENNDLSLKDKMLLSIDSVLKFPYKTFTLSVNWFSNVPFSFFNEIKFMYSSVVPKLKEILVGVGISYPQEKAESIIASIMTLISSYTKNMSYKEFVQKINSFLFQLKSIEADLFNEDMLSEVKRLFEDQTVTELEGNTYE